MATPASGATGASTRAIIWFGVIGAAAFAAVIGFMTLQDSPEPASPPVAETATAPSTASDSVAPSVAPAPPPAVTEPAPAPEVAQAPAPAPAPVPAETPVDAVPTVAAAPADQAVVAPTTEIAAPTLPAEIAAPMMAPVLDVVRVDADGNAVIAGRAAPEVKVVLFLDAAPIAEVMADGAGNFVALLVIAPDDKPRVLTLEAVSADGTIVAGADSVLIAPFALAVAEAAIAQPATVASPEVAPTVAAPSASETAIGEAVPAPEPAPAQAEVVAQAPAVVIAGQDGIRVVQGATAQVTDKLYLDAITYDEAGVVALAGRGQREADLHVMLDATTVSTSAIDDRGQWSVALSNVAPGTYRLRVEQRDARGVVTDALETPFLREDPARIRGNPMLVEPGSSVITVQRGFTLWGIAEANFGSGFLYVQIFQENSEDIRDPDLIYPGQIFALPDLPRVGAAQ